MGVNYLDEWVEKDRLFKQAPLDLLRGSVIGVDAAYFSKKFLTEPLLTALGGSPIALEALTNALQELKEAGIALHFVFDGLSFKKATDPFSLSTWTSQQNAEAFAAYEDETPERARHTFQELVKPNLDDHMDVIKAALHKSEVPFTVAPYSALAQLAYFERHPSQYIDLVYGPTELFYFGVEKVITDFGLSTEDSSEKGSNYDGEKSNFRWIDSNHCLRALGVSVHPLIFVDALVIAGSEHFLSTYPPLAQKAGAIYSPLTVLRDAIQFIVSNRGNLSQPLESLSATDKMSWLDQYKQVMTIIKHHVIITADGDIECVDKDHAPYDVHTCIGLRLPEELYMYLGQGAVGTRVLNYLTCTRLVIPTPLAGASSARLQEFATKDMEVLRQQTVCLLTESLHRYYQRGDIQKLLWFDKDKDAKFKPVNVNPSPHRLVSSWFVRGDALRKKQNVTWTAMLSYAALALQDGDFAKQTVTPRGRNDASLSSKDDILANTTWRFLQLRDYVNEAHQLTAWGKVLCASLSSIQGSSHLEEAVFISIELLRYGLLDTAPVSVGDKGNPQNGSEEDKKHCMLVSRVASTGRLRHKSIGYSGPLSRSLLAYHSYISTLWWALRDLLEMNLAAGLLDGTFERSRDDWMELSLRLPFHTLSACSLGIATWTYLDHLEQYGDPTAKETRERTRSQAQQWIKFSEFDSSLDDAFQIWDAVYSGVRAADTMVNDRSSWDQANEWLAHRR